MEVDSDQIAFKSNRLVKVGRLLASIESGQDGLLQIITGNYEIETGLFDRFETIKISHEENTILTILAHKLCFDLFGASLLVIVYTAFDSVGRTSDCHVAYVYVEQKRFETKRLFSSPSVQASIGIDSQVVVLDVHARVLSYIPAFGTPSPTVESLELEKGFSIISLVQLHGNLSWGPLAPLEFPVLLHISKAHSQPVEPQDFELSLKDDHLDLWSLSTMLDLFNSSKILQNVREDLNTSAWSAGTGRNSFFASIRLVQGRLQLKTCPSLDSLLLHLPTEPITHLYALEEDKPLLFGTSTCLVSITSTCLPRFCASLSSPISELFPLNSGDDSEIIAILLENGTICVLDLLDGHQVAITSPGICTGMLSMDLTDEIESEGLLLSNPAPGSENAKLQWYSDPLFGKWALASLKAVKSLQTNALGTRAAESATDGNETNPAKTAISSMTTGAESLVNALKGRLTVARQALEEIRQRLDAKERILEKAMKLMSSLSCASERASLNANNDDIIPFVVDEGLSPIIGVDQMPKEPNLSKSKKSNLHASYLHFNSVQYASVDDKFLIQLSITNKQEKHELMICNAMANSGKIELFVQLAQSLSIAPNQIGIASIVVKTLEESCSSNLEISLLLEAMGGQRRERFVIPVTALVLNPFAPTTFQSSLPIFPFTSSLLITSQHSIMSTEINQILSSRFRELFAHYGADGSSSNSRHISEPGKGDNMANLPIQEAGMERTFVAASDPSNPFATTSTPLMIKTHSQSNVTCLDIGALDEESLIRCVQFIRSHADQSLSRSIPRISSTHRPSSSSSDANTSAQSDKFTMTENPLSMAFLRRYSDAISALKQEIQLAVTFSQTIEGEAGANKQTALWGWKQKFVTAQASSDLAMASL
jgi:hypothetical protein